MGGSGREGMAEVLGVMWGLEMFFFFYEDEGGLLVGLVIAVDSLKCSQHAQVLLNFVGLSFA